MQLLPAMLGEESTHAGIKTACFFTIANEEQTERYADHLNDCHHGTFYSIYRTPLSLIRFIVPQSAVMIGMTGGNSQRNSAV